MKKILVPYDFSEVSKHALNFACEIADSAKSEIILLNVIEHPTADSFKTMGIQNMDPMEQVYIRKMIEQVEVKLNAVGLEAKYSNILYKIQLGNAFNTIIDQIIDENVDLVVMGTEGADGLNELFVGSNAERVVRKASCPVITVQNKCEIEPIKSIVFASDFLHTDNTFVAQLKSLQSTLGAQLKVVKINTPASFTSTRHDMKQMEEFVHKNGIENYTIEIYNYKNEEDGIIFYAEDVNADMIAIGTHQRRGVGHFLSGSIAEDITNHSPLPVWTAHLRVD
jgi:nucleotide-binding universal stress UspA family protein